jgi:hypothetical protein
MAFQHTRFARLAASAFPDRLFLLPIRNWRPPAPIRTFADLAEKLNLGALQTWPRSTGSDALNYREWLPPAMCYQNHPEPIKPIP